ncbi:MAG: dockerin type I domain-containing protein [Chthoniobacterales bacterium]
MDEKDTYGLITRFNAITAVSRKVHGSAGIFDIPLPLMGSPGIECRDGGATGDYQVVIIFPTAVTTAQAQITQGTGTASSTTVATNEVIVNLTGVTDGQTLQVTVAAVNDGTQANNITIPLQILVGDTNNNGAVNSSDVGQTKGDSGQTTKATNFRRDVNANGTINSSDVSIVKAKSGGAATAKKPR